MSTNPAYKIKISGSETDLKQTRELVHFISRQHGMDDVDADLVEMAVSEAFHNVLRHSVNETDSVQCDLEISIDDEVIKVVVTDRGEAFDFDSIEPFDISQDFMAYKNGGLGIPLMKALMDEVLYERRPDNTNRLTLIKRWESKAKQGGRGVHENKRD